MVYIAQNADNSEHVLLPGGGQLNAGHETSSMDTFIPQIILSCFVFWLFGFIFGLIAFVLAGKSLVICSHAKTVGLFKNKNTDV